MLAMMPGGGMQPGASYNTRHIPPAYGTSGIMLSPAMTGIPVRRSDSTTVEDLSLLFRWKQIRKGILRNLD